MMQQLSAPKLALRLFRAVAGATALQILLAAPSAIAAVSGAVYGEDGKPVAKAEVRAYRAEAWDARRQRIVDGGARPLLASATTNDRGAFSLNAKTGGVLELEIAHSGFAPKQQYVLSDDDAVVLTLTAAPARVLRVTADGKPVRGAKVVARHQLFTETLLGETNEQGELSVPDPKGWAERFTILHPGFAVLEEPMHGRAGLAFTLTRGLPAAGTVIGAGGKPVAKATVFANLWPAGTTGEDGTFAVQLPPKTQRVLAVTSAGQGSATRRDKEMTITLTPGRVVTGTVADNDRRPLAGLPIAMYPRTNEPDEAAMDLARFAISDDRGTFRFEHVATERYAVTGWPIADFEIDHVEADLRNNERASVELIATRNEQLRGYVRNEKNEPVGGATVSVLHPQSPLIFAGLPAELPIARTAADGSFRLTYTSGGSPGTRLAAVHTSYAAGLSEPIGEDLKKAIAITLPNGVEVQGLVVDAEDKPVAGAAVVLVQEPRSMGMMSLDVALANGSIRPFVSSGADGTFRLRLNPVVHDLIVRKEGYAPSRQNVTPGAGEPLRTVLQRGVTIAGRVVRKDGTPVTEGTVNIRGLSGGGMALLDGSGAFTSDSLAPGPYTVHFYGKSGRAEKTVKAPASDVVIELPAMGEIHGTVTDKATGMPLERFSVNVEAQFDEFEGTSTFTMPAPAGRTTVAVSSDGYVTAHRDLTIQPGKPQNVTFALSRARSIRGRVVGTDGAALSGVTIYPESPDERMAGEQVESTADGSFQLDGVGPELVIVTFQRNGFVSRRLDVPANAPQPLTVVLSKGRTVRGRVVDEKGAAIAGAQVWTSSAAHEVISQNAESATDGTFIIEGLSDARHHFQARKEGVGQGELQDVDVTRDVPIVIAMKSAGPGGTIHGRITGLDTTEWFSGYVYARGESEVSQGTIDRNGTYRIEHVPVGEVSVRAMVLGLRNESSSQRVTVTMTAGADVEVNLAFSDDTVVRGTVTQDGQPVIGIDVSFRSDDGTWRTSTGTDGSYEVRGLEPGTFQVTAQDQSRMYRTKLDVSGSTTFDIRIDLAPLTGQVVDGEGVPLGGVKIEADPVDGGYADELEALTADDGTFELFAAQRNYDIRAAKKGYATATQRTQPGGAPLLFRLAKTDGLRVRLVDARNGTTLGGYAVAADSRGTQLGKVHEQERDGTLSLALAAGSYRISVSADGYASQTMQASVPSTGELRIGLTPGGTLVIRAGQQARELVKLVMPGGREYIRCHCNGIAEIRLNGATTTVEHVAPGAYTMQVLDGRGKVITTVPVMIAEGQTSTVEVSGVR